MKTYYIYAHFIPGSEFPFYIGKGASNTHRYSAKKNRTDWWRSMVKKYCPSGFPNVRFLAENIESEEEAFDIERFWIAVLGRKSLGEGCLVNISEGGQGPSGWVPSEETKAKISTSLMGRFSGPLNPMYGVDRGPMSEEQKQKIATTMRKHWETHDHPSVGKPAWNSGRRDLPPSWNAGISTGPMSEEQKKRISETQKEKYKHQVHHRKGKPSWLTGSKGQGLIKAWNAGLPAPEFTCSVCGKVVRGQVNLIRWHEGNCKLLRVPDSNQ